MKMKHLVTASLLLTILAIGAVSASQDVIIDDVQIAGDEIGDIVENSVDDVVEQNDDAEHAIESYAQEDSNVEIKDNIDINDVSNTALEVVFNDENIKLMDSVNILDHDANVGHVRDVNIINGSISIYVDDVLKLTKTFSSSEEQYIYSYTLFELGLYNNITLGKHKVKAVTE